MANPPDRTLTTDRQAEGEASPPEGSPAPLRPRRTRTFKLIMTAAEHEALQRMAADEGVAMATWLRGMIRSKGKKL
jgi:hypothetical protein